MNGEDAQTEFIPDDCKANEEKNSKLSEHLLGTWVDKPISMIKRIDTGQLHGWKASF